MPLMMDGIEMLAVMAGKKMIGGAISPFWLSRRADVSLHFSAK